MPPPPHPKRCSKSTTGASIIAKFSSDSLSALRACARRKCPNSTTCSRNLAKFSADSLRRSRPAAREGWLRAGVKVRSHKSVPLYVRKRGTSTRSYAAVLGSNLFCRLSRLHKHPIHCFCVEGTSGAPRKGASRDIHFATIFENIRKSVKIAGFAPGRAEQLRRR